LRPRWLVTRPALFPLIARRSTVDVTAAPEPLKKRPETMTVVDDRPGRDFGISRKTGYKIFDRYKEHGSRKPLVGRFSFYPTVTGKRANPRSSR
jgi:hypothetical protein